MPVETLTRTVHATFVTNAGVDYAFSSDQYSDDNEGTGDSFPSDFWASATVTNPGGDSIKIFARNNVGGISTIALIPPGTHQLVADDADGFIEQLVEAYRGDHGFPGVFAGMLEGDPGTMPATVTMAGTYTYDYEHHYGQDIDATMAPYTWRDATVEDVSTWEAPVDPLVSDNEFYIGAIAKVGTDWDASGVPEVGTQIFMVAVYQRSPDGSISGEYLGSDRRFMGY